MECWHDEYVGGVRNVAEQRRLLWRRIAWSERISNEFCAVVYGGLFGFVRRAREKKVNINGQRFFSFANQWPAFDHSPTPRDMGNEPLRVTCKKIRN